MRTASFGLGRQRLDMCIRGGNLGRDEEWARANEQWMPGLQAGISEDALIPFAIVGTLRLRLMEANVRNFGGRRRGRYG